jgi:hypothetical protein
MSCIFVTNIKGVGGGREREREREDEHILCVTSEQLKNMRHITRLMNEHTMEME